MKPDSCRWARSAHRRVLALAILSSAIACASAPKPNTTPYQVGTSVGVPPSLPAPSSTPVLSQLGGAGGPPSMAPVQPGIVGMPSARVNITAKNEDLSEVIRRMATQVGLSAVIDPDVRGPVTRTLQNVSLSEAMMSLVGNQYQYQVRSGALVVSPVSLVHHTYTVDYLTMSRISTGSTVVSRGTQGATSNTSLVAGASGTGTGVSSSGGGLVASGADVIQSSSQADFWGELTQQLESIIFGSSSDSVASVRTSAVSGGSRPFNRCDLRVCLRISPLTSLVDVTASADKQEEVARYIGLFSGAMQRQVLIKAQVVEVRLDRTRNYGIDWSAVLTTARATLAAASRFSVLPSDPTADLTSTGNSSFNIGIGDLTLRAVISALETVGDVSVVANPQTAAMNQQKASFNVTRQQQFVTITRSPIFNSTGGQTGFSESPSIQTATVGLVFDVLPQISDKNIVHMAIRPSLTTLVSTTKIVGSNGTLGELPVTDHRETDTMARVRSGETIVIGGLIQKQTQTTRTGVPLLKDIPFFGRFFSSTRIEENNSELVIFLTPEIISGQPPGGR